jgi:1,2-diacylglycerol 3-alpha-glucosyltransferase
VNILMMTNTYPPFVGGVSRSVQSLSGRCRQLGHAVLVVAPTFDDASASDKNVVRVPAIQRFNGSDFSVRLPIPGLLSAELDRFRPDIVHSHHPFLLGDTALRIATARELPLVFTHHTMYERYTHYVPGDSPALQRYVAQMAVEYANLCDHVVAPSESIKAILMERGVKAPISAIPTGIDEARFADGDGAAARAEIGLASDAFVVGHVGRLAPEKNLAFTAEAVAAFVREREDGHFVVVGEGPSAQELKDVFEQRRIPRRLHLVGSLEGQRLADAYHAMDAFAFASHTETQGMVLAEALMAGAPVVAVDAPGAREVVLDGRNGFLLAQDDVDAFAASLERIAAMSGAERETLREQARRTGKRFALDRSVNRFLDLYRRLLAAADYTRTADDPWVHLLRMVETEWNLWARRASAAARSISEQSSGRKRESPA